MPYGRSRRIPASLSVAVLSLALGIGANTAKNAVMAVGVALGPASAWWLGRLVEHLLFSVSVADHLVTGAAVAVMVCAAALAGFAPALRAARVDPMAALRCE